MADSKITQLNANTTPATTDLLVIEDDPSGSPETQKIALSDVLKVVSSLTAITSGLASADELLYLDNGVSKKITLDNLFSQYPTGSVPSARAFNSGAIEISDLTIEELTFDSERWDTDSIHSTVSNTGRLTANTAGRYQINLNVSFESNSTGWRSAYIYLNNTTYIAQSLVPAVNGNSTVISLSTTYNLSASDYVTAAVYQNSGGAIDIELLNARSPEFSMTRIG